MIIIILNFGMRNSNYAPLSGVKCDISVTMLATTKQNISTKDGY